MEHTEKINLKQALYNQCLDLLNTRIATAKYAMEEAQKSANEEGKSSMGDKYETARAMGQIVRDMNAKQMQEGLKDLAVLQQIKQVILHEKVAPGSIVQTEDGNYFIAVSLGKITLNCTTYMAVSQASPLAQAMLNKKEGEKFDFRGKKTTIKLIF